VANQEVNGCGAGIRASEKTLVQEGGAVDQHGKKDDVAMKAVICETPGRLAMIDRPRPEPALGEVLVHIRRIGVCGTDFHIFGGKHPFLEYPRVMGHELSGTVERVPEGSTLSQGQDVYIVPYLSCQRCAACRKGLTNACQNIRVLGVHCDGGMAEYLSLPERNVVPTDGASLDDAAMIEFLAIGAHGVKRGAVTAADRVLVVGSGPIGMAAIIFAKSRGAEVTVMDMREDRLAFTVDQLGANGMSSDTQIYEIRRHRLLRRHGRRLI